MAPDNLIYAGQRILESISNYIELVEDAELTNEQWFIDWMDLINELSVKY